MTRLILHPGFHKTGTSSVQAALKANRERLGTRVHVALKADILPVTESARIWSKRRGRLDLGLMQGFWAEYLEELHLGPLDCLIVSAEDLAGHMPGRMGLTRYDAAPTLIAALCETAQLVLGAGCDITVHLSTRAAAPWIESLHWQYLVNTPLTEDLATFAANLPEAADHAAILAQIRDALPEDVTAQMIALEDSTTMAQGPLTPLLDLAGVSDERRADLRPEPPANARPRLPDVDLPQALLELNRAGLPRTTLTAEKKALLAKARKAQSA